MPASYGAPAQPTSQYSPYGITHSSQQSQQQPQQQQGYNPYGSTPSSYSQPGMSSAGAGGLSGQGGYRHPSQSSSGGGISNGTNEASMKQKIVIPSVCVGNVIGRGGSIISDIRQKSGTNISVAHPEPTTPGERVVTITGSTQGIQTAVMMIKDIVEGYGANKGAGMPQLSSIPPPNPRPYGSQGSMGAMGGQYGNMAYANIPAPNPPPHQYTY
jgi:hypothetical protein